jgi:hypothetical protein
MEDLDAGPATAIGHGPKTNNFFTTEAKDVPRISALSGLGFPSNPAPRVHTATGTNRIKSSFYSGF